MKLPIAYYGNPILRKKALRVTQFDTELQELVKNMEETMVAYNGVGLAAPQVHVSKRIFLVRPIFWEEDQWITGKLWTFINPEISNPSTDEELDEERCISIPGLSGNVWRPLQVHVKAQDVHGKEFEETFEGYEARIILHENDHINGVLFIDRIRGKERKLLDPALGKLKKKYS